MLTFNIFGLPPGLPLEIWGPFLLQPGGNIKNKGYLYIFPVRLVKAIAGFSKPTLLISNIAFSNSTVNFCHLQQRAVQLLFYTMDKSIATQAPKGHHLQTLHLPSPKLCFLHISMSQVIPANIIAATTVLRGLQDHIQD